MSIVDDGYEHLAGVIDAMGLFDESAFAAEVQTFHINLEGLTQDTQRAVVGVQRAVDHGGKHAFGVVAAQCVLDGALAGAGLADEDTETALLTTHPHYIDTATDLPELQRADPAFRLANLPWR